MHGKGKKKKKKKRVQMLYPAIWLKGIYFLSRKITGLKTTIENKTTDVPMKEKR